MNLGCLIQLQSDTANQVAIDDRVAGDRFLEFGGPHRASKDKVHFADTLDFEHAGLPVTSASQRLLKREATRLGRALHQRIIVTTFETAVRVVRTGAAISIAPREIAEALAPAYQLKLLPLDEPWAVRRFVICFREKQSLTPSARLLLDHLGSAHTVP